MVVGLSFLRCLLGWSVGCLIMWIGRRLFPCSRGLLAFEGEVLLSRIMSMHCIQDDRWNQFQKIKINTCLLPAGEVVVCKEARKSRALSFMNLLFFL
jgi:hypothetical protein